MPRARIAMIVAFDRNRVIGRDGKMPWHISGDLKFFKRTTLGKPVVMGRKTWEALPFRPLPGRPNIVVSRSPGLVLDGAETFPDLEAALDRAIEYADEAGVDEAMVIGGANLYRQALPHARKLYLTEIDMAIEGDAYFPEIDAEDWHEISRGPDLQEDGICYRFLELERLHG